MSDVGCICTCARAHPFSISRKRPVELRQNVVYGYGSIMGVFYTCRRWGASVRAHVQITFPYRQHEQPTFGPQRYPKSAASQVISLFGGFFADVSVNSDRSVR